MALSQETPPNSFDEDQREWLSRRFIDVGVLFQQPSKYPERREMPYKPRIGDIQYFGDPLNHSYDPVITGEGWWGFKSTGWVLIA